MHFKVEVMEGDEITIHFKAKLSDDCRKIFRNIDIINKNGQVAVQIQSNGAFLHLEKRRVVPASARICRKFQKYLRN